MTTLWNDSWKKISGDKFWRGKDGKVVVWQRPNALLWIWIFATISSKFINGSNVGRLQNLAFGSIVVWACLEIVKGDSYFRRLLGLIVLILTIASRLL